MKVHGWSPTCNLWWQLRISRVARMRAHARAVNGSTRQAARSTRTLIRTDFDDSYGTCLWHETCLSMPRLIRKNGVYCDPGLLCSRAYPWSIAELAPADELSTLDSWHSKQELSAHAHRILGVVSSCDI